MEQPKKISYEFETLTEGEATVYWEEYAKDLETYINFLKKEIDYKGPRYWACLGFQETEKPFGCTEQCQQCKEYPIEINKSF